MEISEVKVKLVNKKDSRLRAFCTISIDEEFVVRDIKVIEGGEGFFVAMPSRKMNDHCKKCGSKNHLKAKFCNNCGVNLHEGRARKDSKGKMKLYADIVHPIHNHCRKKMQEKVIKAFKEEIQKSKEPGYRSVEMDQNQDEVPDIVS